MKEFSTYSFDEAFDFVRNGASIKQEDEKNGVPITRIETIWNSTIDENRFGYADINENLLSKYDKYLLQEGDILMTHINSVKHLGKCAIYKGNPKQLIHGMNLLSLRPKNKILFPSYIYYYFKSRLFKSQLPQITNQSVNQASFSAGKLKKLKIPLPPLPVQQKIATILDTADALKQKDKALMAKYDELSQSLFLDMFGDPVTNPKGWSYSKFGDCVLDIIGGKSVGGEERPILKGEMAVLKISSVTSGHFKADKYKVVENNKIPPVCIKPEKNDLLFSRANTREMVGAVCIVNANYSNLFLPDKLWKIILEPETLSSWYVKFLLSHDGFRENLRKVATGTSGSMLNISKSKLKNLKIPVPSIELQNQFAKRIQAIEQQKQQAQASLKKSEDLFNCLLQKAFKGELG